MFRKHISLKDGELLLIAVMEANKSSFGLLISCRSIKNFFAATRIVEWK